MNCIPLIPRYLIDCKKRRSLPPEYPGFLFSSIPFKNDEAACEVKR